MAKKPIKKASEQRAKLSEQQWTSLVNASSAASQLEAALKEKQAYLQTVFGLICEAKDVPPQAQCRLDEQTKELVWVEPDLPPTKAPETPEANTK